MDDLILLGNRLAKHIGRYDRGIKLEYPMTPKSFVHEAAIDGKSVAFLTAENDYIIFNKESFYDSLLKNEEFIKRFSQEQSRQPRKRHQ